MEPNGNIPKQPVRPVNPAGAGVPSRPMARPVAPRPTPSAPASEPKEANEPTFDNGPSVVGKKGRKTGWVLAIILLLIIAAGGVGFGVWAWMDGNTQRDQLSLQISALQQANNNSQEQNSESDEIDTGLLRNLIEPYLGSFHYANNIFNYDFDDNVRVELAFQNLRPSDVLEEGADSYMVSYNTLNGKYKELFGNDLDIVQKDYAVGELGDRFYYSDNSFRVVPQPGGGAGVSIVSAVKDGYYDGDNVVAEVYHDAVAWCEMSDSEYCLGGWPLSQDEALELFNRFSDSVPLYKMIFSIDDGHYVLVSVEKEQ